MPLGQRGIRLEPSPSMHWDVESSTRIAHSHFCMAYPTWGAWSMQLSHQTLRETEKLI